MREEGDVGAADAVAVDIAEVQRQLDAFLARSEGDVLLWHDPAGTHADVLDALVLPQGVSLVREGELAPFACKVRLERLVGGGRVLVYRRVPGEVAAGDWLADLEARCAAFSVVEGERCATEDGGCTVEGAGASSDGETGEGDVREEGVGAAALDRDELFKSFDEGAVIGGDATPVGFAADDLIGAGGMLFNDVPTGGSETPHDGDAYVLGDDAPAAAPSDRKRGRGHTAPPESPEPEYVFACEEAAVPTLSAALSLPVETTLEDIVSAALEREDASDLKAFAHELLSSARRYILVPSREGLRFSAGLRELAARCEEVAVRERFAEELAGCISPGARASLVDHAVSSWADVLSLGWEGILSLPRCNGRVVAALRDKLRENGVPVERCFTRYPEFDAGVVLDMPISRIAEEASWTAAPCHRMRIHTVRDLLEVGFERLEQQRGAAYALAVYRTIRSLPGVKSVGSPAFDARRVASEDAKGLYTFLQDVFCGFSGEDADPDAVEERYVLMRLGARPFGIAPDELRDDPIARALGRRFGGVDDTIARLAASGKVAWDGGRVSQVLPDLFSLLEQEGCDAREVSILRMRAQGKTLEEIGHACDLARERVRQILSHVLNADVLKRSAQGTFLPLAERYKLTEGEFSTLFDVPTEDAALLTLAARKGRGRLPIECILEDEAVPFAYRDRVDRYLHRDELIIDGHRMKRDRKDVLIYLLRRHASNASITEPELERLYHELLARTGVAEEGALVVSSRYIEAPLKRLPGVLSMQGRRLRYWSFSDHDMADLVARLDWGHFQDKEFSAQAFFSLQPELLDEFDLHDGYELHNALRRYAEEEEHGALPFSLARRSPILLVGTADGRERQVLEMAKRLAPVSPSELAREYEAEYGIPVPTFLANYLPYVSGSSDGALISFEEHRPDAATLERLRELLPDDWYAIDDVRTLLAQAFPKGDLLSGITLKEAGFTLYADCIVRFKGERSRVRGDLADYYDTFFTRELVSHDEVPLKIRNAKSFNAHIWHAVMKRQLFDYDENTWITRSGLGALGISACDIETFCDEARKACREGGFSAVTVPYLRREVPGIELFGYECDDCFYESVLKSMSETGSFTRYGSRELFSFGARSSSIVGDFIVSLLIQMGSMSLDDFREVLSESFGIPMERDKLIARFEMCGAYYNRQADQVYSSYRQFIREVE